MLRPLSIGLGLAFLLPGVTLANDFPTQVRVEFVLGCMNERGGESYDTLYKCVCLIDAIADEMSRDEFEEARVFSQLRSTPGERGGVFRDPDQARALVAKLQAVTERGKAKCLIRSK